MLDVLFSTLCLFEIDVLVIVEEIEGLGGLKKFPNLIRGRESVYLMTEIEIIITYPKMISLHFVF